MLELKTHFEQVPLAIIREMIKQQNEAETATEPAQEVKKKTSHKPPSKAGTRQRRNKQ
jgi:hypothetical protein